MGKIDNKTLELRPGSGQGKTIPIPITAIGYLHTDGTGRDVSAADPLPTISGGAGRATVAFLEKSDNAAARVDGTSVGGEVLAAATPYIKATVTARKAVADTDKASIANVGTVWICGAAEDIDGATPLLPGQSMALPDNCDLSDFYLAVDNLGDGVAISYTV